MKHHDHLLHPPHSVGSRVRRKSSLHFGSAGCVTERHRQRCKRFESSHQKSHSTFVRDRILLRSGASLAALPSLARSPATMVYKSDYPKFDQDGPPEDFDPAKPYADPVAMLEQREYMVREKLIQVETAKILRDRLQRCYWREGVNHYQKCRPLVQKYMASLQNIGWGKDARPAYLNNL